MKSICLASSALLLLSADRDLTTLYRAETALRVESSLEVEMETTSMSMLRDGEPIEGRSPNGGGTKSTTRAVAIDRCLAVAGAVPTRVQRRWSELEGESIMTFGGEERSLTLESDFEDLLVEITRDEDGEVASEAVEGSGPAPEVLARLRPELALDALLPTGEVAEDAEWALDSDAVKRGLGLDVVLFRAPEREGGGGRRGGFGGRGGGPELQLAAAEWSGRATFAGLEIFEDVECARIALTLEAESDREDDDGSSTFEAKLEGTLWVDLASRRPLALELEGSVASTMEMTREREGSVTEIQRESAGTCKLSVRVGAAAFADDE